MRSIKKQLVLWHVVLIVGIAVIIAIPAATANVSSTEVSIVTELPQHEVQQTRSENLIGYAGHGKAPKAAVGRHLGPPQDDYYQQRRQYWEKRIDRRLEYRDEYLNEQTGNKNDEDAKDSDAKSEGGDGEEDAAVDKDAGSEEEFIERRREYWRQRLDEDW